LENKNQTAPSESENKNGETGQFSQNTNKEGDKKIPQRGEHKKYYRRPRRRYYDKRKTHENAEKKTLFKSISIVIPLYNEEESLNLLTAEIRKDLSQINISYEVLFVDDGSNDKSLQVIKEICRTDKRFRYISFRKNYGKSAALQIGFKNVKGDVVITMDADLQDDPGEIPHLLKKLEEGFDLVSGWKKKRYDPLIKKYSSRFFNFVTRVLSGIKIHDFNCGLKAYRREVVDNIKIYGELHRYVPVFAKWQGYSVSEVVVQHHPRRYGKTKFGTSRFFKGFIDLITVIFTTRYIQRPMHLFGFFGAISFLVGLIVNGYLTIDWISGKPLSNRPMLFLGMLLIIVGVQFFSVGLLGEMMVHNAKSDEDYVIKDKG
jgi:glycosyltransferase involved in cell wall biosynthesis